MICSDDDDSNGWWTSGLANPELLTDYEIMLLVMAVMGESMNGTFPTSWMEGITWIYLNRLGHGTHSSLYKAIKGVQSAYTVYERDLFPKMEGEDLESYAFRFFDEFADWEIWEPVYDLVLAQYQKWSNFGTGSFADPVNGATNFNIKQPAANLWDAATKKHPNDSKSQREFVDSLSVENGLIVYPYRERTYPGFSWGYSGPEFGNGLEMYFFWSNISLIPGIK